MSRRWHDAMQGHAAQQPEAMALEDSLGTRWSYAALAQASADLAEVLRDRNVCPGDRVMVLAENCATAVAAFFAASQLGACAVPINARQTAPEIDRILAHATPAAIVFTTDASSDAVAHGQRMGARDIAGSFGQAQLLALDAGPADAGQDVAAMLYTTGTTGMPKGVMLTHDNLCFAGQAAAEYRSLSPASRIYGVAPMTHVIGLASMMTASLHAGATVQLEARFSVERLFEAVQAGITHLPAVPQMHALFMQYVQAQGIDGPEDTSLVYVSSGGAPLDPAWKRKAEAFYHLPLQNGYGLTECTAAASITFSEIGDPDVSVGQALPEVTLRIDESVPGGGDGEGEVLVRGPNVMKGYYRNPEETAKVLDADGWLRSGDLGRIDDQGRLHILGRTKELIIHGGFNVYPPEVEAAFNAHPQVVQCAVVGRMVAGDEKVVAFVRAAPGQAPEVAELRRFVAERLTGYKRPSQIVVAQDLPTAPTGKILKHKLLDVFADQL